MINCAQMLVAREQDVAVEQNGFRQNQGVVDFLGGKQGVVSGTRDPLLRSQPSLRAERWPVAAMRR